METSKYRFNKGTTFGRKMIRKSLEKLGCGRSVVADKDDNIICGNEVYSVAQELGLKIRVIETTGDELIVVKRVDLSEGDRITKELSFVDNLSQEKNLDWDSDALLSCMEDDLTFDPRKWDGHSCIVKELKVEDLFSMDAPKRHVKTESDEDESDDYLNELEQLSLF